jgi:hypothetical protein
MRHPLTLEEAINLSRKYNFLSGQLFDKESLGKGIIDIVTPAPFEESKQWLFAQYYRETRDARKALQFYSGNSYSVVVLSIPILRKRAILYKEIDEFLKDNQHSPVHENSGNIQVSK